MSDEKDFRLKKSPTEQKSEEQVFKVVKLGGSDNYQPPAFAEKETSEAPAPKSTTCSCHSVCGCDSVDSSSCGCHDVCSCDYVCSCDSECSCDGYCSCDSVCTCDSQCSCDSVCTCDTVHYWYPN